MARPLGDKLVSLHDCAFIRRRPIDSFFVLAYAITWSLWVRAMFGFREWAARPVWLFSIGPLGDPPKPEDPEPQELAAAATAIGAREHRVFIGRLDRAALTVASRLMVRAVRAPDGDFGEWGEITAWAHSIAVALGRPPVISANP